MRAHDPCNLTVQWRTEIHLLTQTWTWQRREESTNRPSVSRRLPTSKNKILYKFTTEWTSSWKIIPWEIGTIMKFLSPDTLLVHASIKLHFSLSLVISHTKQKQNKAQTTISVHEFLSDSTFDYPIILLFDARFSNNVIFLFDRCYYFNVYFFNVCLHINRM